MKDSYPPMGEGNEIVITTDTVTGVTQNQATVSVSIQNGVGSSGYNYAFNSVGVFYDTVQPVTSLSYMMYGGNGISSFNVILNGLTPGKRYYACGYAVVGQAYVLGNTVSFMSLPVLPAGITGLYVYSVYSTYAYYQADITSNGGGALTGTGVCWSTSANPTIANNHTSNGTTVGYISGSITGLTHLTTYYVRAYATNAAGTSHSTQISFQTSN